MYYVYILQLLKPILILVFSLIVIYLRKNDKCYRHLAKRLYIPEAENYLLELTFHITTTVSSTQLKLRHVGVYVRAYVLIVLILWPRYCKEISLANPPAHLVVVVRRQARR